MPTYFPISNTVPQYVTPTGAPYSGAVLKAYEDNTTTPIQMATDYTGATLVNTITLNAQGFPAVAGSVVVPHIAENYKLALYPDAASATANTGAIWIVDDFQISSTASFGSLTDVASASTISLNSTATNYFNITGTTTINEITLAEGVEVTVKFAGALTLTNGAFLVLKGGANILTGAGDIAVFRAEAGGVVRMLDYVDVSEIPYGGIPSQTGNSGKLLSTNGTSLLWTAGGNWQKCGETTITGSPADVRFIHGQNGVTFDSTYKQYLLIVKDLYISGSTQTIDLQFANVGGGSPTFVTTGYEYSGKGKRASGGVDANLNGTAAGTIRMSSTINISEAASGSILFPFDPTGATWRKMVLFHLGYQEDSTNAFEYMTGGGVVNSAAVIYGFRLVGSANFSGGTLMLYGSN
jgi:hypothetical protein